MPDPAPARVIAIALKPKRLMPMVEVSRAHAIENKGLIADPEDADAPDVSRRSSRKRGVTLLAAGQWRQACDQLGVTLPWRLRRANLLIDCDDLRPLIGRAIRIGRAQLHVHGVTEPCAKMNHAHPGLEDALTPDGRGGVFGQVIVGGSIRVGDILRLVSEVKPTAR